MVDIRVTRRAAFGVFGAFVVAPSVLLRGALAQPGAGGIHVDVQPLLQDAGEPTAGWVAQLLPGAIAQAMAQRGGGPGGPITVQIHYVILGPSTGAGGPAGSSPDQIVGEMSVGGVAREVRAQTWYYPAPQDQTMIAQTNYDRVSQLVQALAFWIVREV
jgi:hypothetical protein